MKNLIRRRHSVSNLQVHLVFTPKDRRKIFKREHIAFLCKATAQVCESMDCKAIELNGEADHFHLLIQYPPKVAISVLVNSLKAATSRRLRSNFPELKRMSKTSALWSRSYFACSVGGAPIEVLKQYIENQQTPDE